MPFFAKNGYEHIPPGLVLLFINILDSIPLLSSIWRKVIPFGWADPPNGLFSYHVPALSFPPLKTYSEVPGGIIDFLSASDTVLGDISHPFTFFVVIIIAKAIHSFKFSIYPTFQKFAKKIAAQTHGEQWTRDNPERIYKFGEYCFRLIFHSSISLYGLYVFANNDWWHPKNGGTMNFYQNFPNHELKPDAIWYGLLEAGYNLDAMVSIIVMSFVIKVDMKQFPFVTIGWADSVRGDFNEMFLHHIVTNFLVIGGSSCRLSRAQQCFFIIHDISDVPIDISKLSNFLKWKKTTVVCFISMMIIWAITRLTILPFIVYRSIIFESFLVLEEGSVGPEVFYCYRTFFVVLGGGIICLHVIWFGMFVKMVSLFFVKGEQHDLSEHKKGEKMSKKE